VKLSLEFSPAHVDEYGKNEWSHFTFVHDRLAFAKKAPLELRDLLQESPTFEALSPDFGPRRNRLVVEEVGQLGHADGTVPLFVGVAVVPLFLLEIIEPISGQAARNVFYHMNRK